MSQLSRTARASSCKGGPASRSVGLVSSASDALSARCDICAVLLGWRALVGAVNPASDLLTRARSASKRRDSRTCRPPAATSRTSDTL